MEHREWRRKGEKDSLSISPLLIYLMLMKHQLGRDWWFGDLPFPFSLLIRSGIFSLPGPPCFCCIWAEVVHAGNPACTTSAGRLPITQSVPSHASMEGCVCIEVAWEEELGPWEVLGQPWTPCCFVWAVNMSQNTSNSLLQLYFASCGLTVVGKLSFREACPPWPICSLTNPWGCPDSRSCPERNLKPLSFESLTFDICLWLASIHVLGLNL